jgi:ABC-type transport system involved in multi-copper enzyme maturation permease subunit
MIGAVLRFELGYRARQPSTWVYATVLTVLPFLLMHIINGSSQYLNAPEMVLNASAILGGLGILVSAGVFGDAAARDVATRMHALFYTSPLRERDYLIGRFLGAVVINALLLMGIPLGLLLASVMPYMEAGKFGIVQPAAYVQAYVLMLLPNALLVGACMFAAAALTRTALATYVGGITLYVLGLMAADLTESLPSRTLSALADPFGAAAVRLVTRFWTPAERNVQLIGWPAIVVWNRLLWMAVAVLVIALAVARFRFAHPVGLTARRWWRRRVVADPAPERVVPITALRVPTDARSFTLAARVRQTLAVMARAWREIAATRAFLLILAGALAFVFAFGWDVGTEIFGTSTWPVTHLVAGTVLSTALAPVMAVLIAILAGELVWRERDAGMGDMADVAPVPNSVLLLGRFLALVAMLVVLQLVLAGAGMLLQTLREYHHYEPLVYLQLLFGVKLLDYVLLAALAMTVHVLVNNKYVGHLVVVLCIAITIAPGMIGLRHNMLIYGADTGWVWSDFNGLSPFVTGMLWFRLYWASWALLLVVLASLFWVRGRERDLRRRLTLARQRFVGATRTTAIIAATAVVGTGSYVCYNTNILNAYRTPDEIAERAASYERQYKQFEHAPRPSLVAVSTQVELYPSRRAADVRGTFRLVNRTAQPIDSLHVLLHADVATRTLRFSRAATAVLTDSVLHYRIYALERPLAPGDTIVMTFELAYAPRGFRNAGAPTEVTTHSAYLDGSWLPGLGYRVSRELTDDVLRRKHGLAPRVSAPSAGDVETRTANARDVEEADVETIIGTDTTQIAVTPGRLVREWREHGRRYFHYRTDAPVRFAGALFSAEYAMRDAQWEGLPLRVYYHSGHDINVGRMLRSMQASLAYYSQQFGPYQFRELRVVEFPRYASFARAHPHTIAFSEGSAFLTRVDSGEVDRTFFVIAHETAHQWWGGQVIPVRVPGAGMVSETLAQYSSMMVLETAYGLDMARRFYDYNMTEYLRGRTVFTNREVPLLDVSGQSYVHYFKGATAMYTLRDRLGADVVNGALRRFRERYSGPDAPPATSRALYAELTAVTPDSLRPLLADLFEHITLWSLRTDSTRAEPAGNGQWRVTIYAEASKVRADSVGKQTPIAMDDLVEVGVFGPRTSDGALGEPMYLKQHRIRGGKTIITVMVPRQPAIAGIDPYRKFIERERDDNVATISAPPAR